MDEWSSLQHLFFVYGYCWSGLRVTWSRTQPILGQEGEYTTMCSQTSESSWKLDTVKSETFIFRFHISYEIRSTKSVLWDLSPPRLVFNKHKVHLLVYDVWNTPLLNQLLRYPAKVESNATGILLGSRSVFGVMVRYQQPRSSLVFLSWTIWGLPLNEWLKLYKYFQDLANRKSNEGNGYLHK